MGASPSTRRSLRRRLSHPGLQKNGERVRLWSRNGRDWSAEFVAITAAVRPLPFKRVMFDGEAVAHCLEGLPHFHKLFSHDGQVAACLYAFDLLWLEAQDVRGLELIGRRRMRQKALRKAAPTLRFSQHMAGETARRCSAKPAPWGLRGSSRKS